MCGTRYHEVEQFIFREAYLLDTAQFDEWATLFTEDGLYWAPMDVVPPASSRGVPSLLYEDGLGRTQRIAQYATQRHHAQVPPSRTLRTVSNVMLDGDPDQEIVSVRCSVVIAEVRPAEHRGQQLGLGVLRMLPARYAYRLRRGQELKIVEKRVDLLTRDLPQDNLTFLL